MKPKTPVQPWHQTGANLNTIFCDLDGCLTRVSKRGAPLWTEMIQALRKAKTKGWKIVIWSGNGEQYVRDFVKKHEIPCDICLDKPCIAIDDRPDIRPKQKGWFMNPQEFLKWAR